MKVAVQSSSLNLHSSLFEEDDSCTVHRITPEEMIDVLRTSLYSNSSTDELDESLEVYDCVILNTEDIVELNQILDFLIESADTLNRRPRFILLSRLLSWGGKRYKVPVGTSISEFNTRNPYLTHEALYKVENKFQSCANLTKMDMCVVGVGMIYGSKGYDMADLFMKLFIAEEGTEEVIFSSSQGSNLVPMIHFFDLVQILEHLASTPAAFPNFFIPAVDLSTESLASVFKAVSKITCRNVRCTTSEEAIDMAMNSNKTNAQHQWDIDMSFSDSHRLSEVVLTYPFGMTQNTAKVWKEFMGESCSPPSSILVAGPPSSLKTTIAKDLANTLGLKYVDWALSVRHCLEAFSQKAPPEEIQEAFKRGETFNNNQQDRLEDVTIDLSEVRDSHVALRLEIERVIKVSRKMKDDAVLDLNTVTFDKQLLATIPKTEVIDAVAALITTDEQCLKRGYVLDVWGMDEQILVGRHQLYDITNTRPPIPEPPVVENVEKVEGETDDKAPEAIQNVEEESLESVDTYKYKEGAVVDKKPNLIVELQCDAATSIQRFLTPLGIVQDSNAKLSKDQQAHIKDIETRTNHYISLLKPVVTDDPANENSDEKTSEEKKDSAPSFTALSHPLVLQCHSDGYEVVRIDVTNVPPPVASDNETSGQSGNETKANKDKEDVEESKEEVEEKKEQPANPTDAVVKEIYERYAIAHGPLDWVNIGVDALKTEEHTRTLVTNFSREFEGGDEVVIDNSDDGKDIFDLEEEAMQEEQYDNQEISAPPNRIEELNNSLQALGPDICNALRPSSEKLNNYLVDNVLPHVAEALVIIHRDKIEDPVYFMSNFLRKRGEELEVNESERAFEKYIAAVKEAEKLEEEAAKELQHVVESSCDEWD